LNRNLRATLSEASPVPEGDTPFASLAVLASTLFPAAEQIRIHPHETPSSPHATVGYGAGSAAPRCVSGAFPPSMADVCHAWPAPETLRRARVRPPVGMVVAHPH